MVSYGVLNAAHIHPAFYDDCVILALGLPSLRDSETYGGASTRDYYRRRLTTSSTRGKPEEIMPIIKGRTTGADDRRTPTDMVVGESMSIPLRG